MIEAHNAARLTRVERQIDELTEAYAPWLALEVGDREDGWVLLTGRRA